MKYLLIIIISLAALPRVMAASFSKHVILSPIADVKYACWYQPKKSGVTLVVDAEGDPLLTFFPSIRKNGKKVMVSVDEYIKHHLKGVTTKYMLIAVPDG